MSPENWGLLIGLMLGFGFVSRNLLNQPWSVWVKGPAYLAVCWVFSTVLERLDLVRPWL